MLFCKMIWKTAASGLGLSFFFFFYGEKSHRWERHDKKKGFPDKYTKENIQEQRNS